MNQQQLIQHMSNTFEDCLKIAKAKNSDYAGDGDAFRNFRNSEAAGVDAARGMLVRMMDKISRISNLVDLTREVKVKDESIADSCSDLINYAAILKAYLQTYGVTQATVREQEPYSNTKTLEECIRTSKESTSNSSYKGSNYAFRKSN